MSSHRVYPKHEEFVEKMRRVDEKGLAAVLKRIDFLAQTKVCLFWKHLEKRARADFRLIDNRERYERVYF